MFTWKNVLITLILFKTWTNLSTKNMAIRQISCQNPIRAKLGIKAIDNNQGFEKLEERFNISSDSEGHSSTKRQRIDQAMKTISEYYHLGQDYTSNNILEIVDTLL